MRAMAGDVVYEIVDGCIAVVTLDRPQKLNALDAAMAQGLLDAARACELGLVNRVVSGGQVLDAALAIARHIAANAPIAVQESLAVARLAAELDLAAGRAASDAALARVRATEDVQEGLRSFHEKRAPVWKGR